jgi:hypothetical protein
LEVEFQIPAPFNLVVPDKVINGLVAATTLVAIHLAVVIVDEPSDPTSKGVFLEVVGDFVPVRFYPTRKDLEYRLRAC